MFANRWAGLLGVLLLQAGGDIPAAERAGQNGEERVARTQLYRLEDGIAEYGRVVLDMPNPGDVDRDPGTQQARGPSGYPTSYVAVRMLFSARTQLKAILESRGEAQETPSNRGLLDIQDFEIQRCEAITGPEGETTWTTWRPCDLKKTLRLLNLVPAFDSEVLPPSVIEPAITMPLPRPKYGYWGPDSKHATHPRLAGLRWTDADRARWDAIRKALLKVNRELEERRKPVGEPNGDNGGQPAERGRWSRTFDIESLLTRLARDQRANRAAREAIRELTADGDETFDLDEFLRTPKFSLFRFVDFDIVPGRAYRYRARLKLANPALELPVERIIQPGVSADEFLKTDWSDPTNAVVVPPNVEFYVRRVDAARRYRPARIEFRLHVWSRELGTWIAEHVWVGVGERVSGTESIRTDVADLVRDVYRENALVRLEAKEVVADLLPIPRLDVDGEIHGEFLGILGLVRFEWSPLTLVVDEVGAAVQIDPPTRRRAAVIAERRYEAQMSALEKVLPEPPAERFGE